MPDKLSTLLLSRRFIVAIVGVAAVVAQDLLGISEEQVTMLSGIVIAWIVGDSVRVTK